MYNNVRKPLPSLRPMDPGPWASMDPGPWGPGSMGHGPWARVHGPRPWFFKNWWKKTDPQITNKIVEASGLRGWIRLVEAYYKNLSEINGLQEEKYCDLVPRTSTINDFQDLPEIVYRCSSIFPYITVRDRGGTAIYTSLYRATLRPRSMLEHWSFTANCIL